MLGDNAYESGTDSEYQSTLFDIYPSMLRKTPLWPTKFAALLAFIVSWAEL